MKVSVSWVCLQYLLQMLFGYLLMVALISKSQLFGQDYSV
jgi:hypothetical protein